MWTIWTVMCLLQTRMKVVCFKLIGWPMLRDISWRGADHRTTVIAFCMIIALFLFTWMKSMYTMTWELFNIIYPHFLTFLCHFIYLSAYLSVPTRQWECCSYIQWGAPWSGWSRRPLVDSADPLQHHWKHIKILHDHITRCHDTKLGKLIVHIIISFTCL